MKRFLQLSAAVLVPALGLLFIASERMGLWDRWLGLNEVERIATRFETSYAEDVDRWVDPGEPGWQPLLGLIRRYSGVSIPKNREPRGVARQVAILSGKIELGDGQIAEWTAPSTPILLVFSEHGKSFSMGDVVRVGAIGDLRVWCDRRRADLKFFMSDLLLGLTTIALGFVLWMVDLGGPMKGITLGKPTKARDGLPSNDPIRATSGLPTEDQRHQRSPAAHDPRV